MAHTSYAVTLSTDGAHQITVRSDDPAAMKSAVLWANATYEALLARAGETLTAPDGDAVADKAEPLRCAVHQVPMARMQGKHGEFWSCHQRMADGSFCSYRPDLP